VRGCVQPARGQDPPPPLLRPHPLPRLSLQAPHLGRLHLGTDIILILLYFLEVKIIKKRGNNNCNPKISAS
jgi:hypothetical protein